MERERLHERERQWNKHQGTPKLARTTSNSSNHSLDERQRTMSHPPRPGSSQSLHIPPSAVTSPGHSRRLERERTVSNPPRPGSAMSNHSSSHREQLKRTQSHPSHGGDPSHSSPTRSRGHKQEQTDSEEHQRERNWNAPRPKWSHHDHHHRSPVQSPSSPARQRKTSLQANHSISPAPSEASTLRAPKATAGNRPLSFPLRPQSPLPPRSPEPPSHRPHLSFPEKSKDMSSDAHRSNGSPRVQDLDLSRRSEASRLHTRSLASSTRASLIPVRSPDKITRRPSTSSSNSRIAEHTPASQEEETSGTCSYKLCMISAQLHM